MLDSGGQPHIFLSPINMSIQNTEFMYMFVVAEGIRTAQMVEQFVPKQGRHSPLQGGPALRAFCFGLPPDTRPGSSAASAPTQSEALRRRPGSADNGEASSPPRVNSFRAATIARAQAQAQGQPPPQANAASESEVQPGGCAESEERVEPRQRQGPGPAESLRNSALVGLAETGESVPGLRESQGSLGERNSGPHEQSGPGPQAAVELLHEQPPRESRAHGEGHGSEASPASVQSTRSITILPGEDEAADTARRRGGAAKGEEMASASTSQGRKAEAMLPRVSSTMGGHRWPALSRLISRSTTSEDGAEPHFAGGGPQSASTAQLRKRPGSRWRSAMRKITAVDRLARWPAACSFPLQATSIRCVRSRLRMVADIQLVSGAGAGRNGAQVSPAAGWARGCGGGDAGARVV